MQAALCVPRHTLTINTYEMNANIDIGTYTSVSVVAKVYTSNGEEKEEEEDDDDSFFPDFDLDNIGKGDSFEDVRLRRMRLVRILPSFRTVTLINI